MCEIKSENSEDVFKFFMKFTLDPGIETVQMLTVTVSVFENGFLHSMVLV